MRIKHRIEITDLSAIKQKLLQWSSKFDKVVWLDSNSYTDTEKTYEAILAVDANRSFQSNSLEALEELKEYKREHLDWLFGYFSFDVGSPLKATNKEDLLDFPKLHFFQPKRLFFLHKDFVEVVYLSSIEAEIETDWEAISTTAITELTQVNLGLKLHPKLTKQEYLDKIQKTKAYIEKGEITEINFCQEFFTKTKLENPLATYLHLNEISSTPFAAYLRIADKYALCASPERYLRNQNGKIKTQPIKGTAKRKQDPEEDAMIKAALEKDEKELTENRIVTEMVVEEMRSIAEEGKVEVTELCKLYSFKQVHQLISTVVCRLSSELDAVDAIKATYPMGSMTGIPKSNSLRLIEELENFNRGLYSGSIGYFTPTGDFDFNVVIRSILYNDTNQYLSFAAGGAITALSNPEKEYEETRVKTKAMEQVLGSIQNL